MKLAAALLLAQINWTLPPGFRSAGYTREFRDGAVVLAGPGPSGALTETVNAVPWRGQAVRLKASIRVEGEGSARLLLRVDRPAGELGFFDDMGDRPIRSGEWATYTVEGEIAADAVDIETGVLSSGKATVFVKDLAFEKLGAPADAASLRALYGAIDAANAAGDAAALRSFALPDAEIVLPSGTLALASVLTGARVQSNTTVTHLRLEGDQATVWTTNEAVTGSQGVLTSNRDLWVRSGGAWKLKRSTLIATRAVTPPEVLAGIRAAAGVPDLKNIRIVLWQGDPKPLDGFVFIPASDPNPAQRAVDYLEQHAPEEAGPARLAFQGDDPARMAAVVRVFENLRPKTTEWAEARHAAALVYQAKTMRPEEAIAANILWYATEGMPNARLIAPVADAAAVAPLVRRRYGKQVYVVGGVPRELLGGDYFLDLSRVPEGTPLARWVAAQKFPFDGVASR